MFASKKGSTARLRRSSKSKTSRRAKQPLISVVPAPLEGIALPEQRGDVSPRLAEYLKTAALPSPCLVVDLDIVEHNYVSLARALPLARIFYAVKANPAPELLRRLANLGSNFDTASPAEIDMCLDLGISPARISYGNTIKKQSDIAYAYARGVRLFAFDSEAELEKLRLAAPGAKVFCRVIMECTGAEWPLSRKFGCEPEMALELLIKAQEQGLDPCGISFHPGSQQTDLGQWDIAIKTTADLFAAAAERGISLSLINMGGGYPARYRSDVPSMDAYAAAIMDSMIRHFGGNLPEMIVEPGRGVVGDAGVIQAEVVLISKKHDRPDARRWVYLDIGKFSGLAETMDEAIKYRIRTPYDGSEEGPVVLAGPTCDSADILYEKAGYTLPLDLKVGDKVLILATGAYTTTYSAVAFNGFAPLESRCI